MERGEERGEEEERGRQSEGQREALTTLPAGTSAQ